MKILIALVVVALATTSSCFPGPSRHNDEVEILPFAKHNQNPFGVVDLDVSDLSDDDFPLGQGWRDGFSAFMKRVTDLVKNVRTQVTKDFEDKLKQGNTTSTVEIINGHKVIKNQTVYEDPHTYVKSVIFEVVPDDNATNSPTNSQAEVDTEPAVKSKDRESLEDSVENEVNALNEVENLNIETLEDNNVPPQHYSYKVDNGDRNIESFEIIEPESINNAFKSPRISDINIETVDSNEIPLPDGSKYNGDNVSNDKSFQSFKPIDLSKDTMVNDILHDQGYPMNPDAEMISLDVPKLVVA